MIKLRGGVVCHHFYEVAWTKWVWNTLCLWRMQTATALSGFKCYVCFFDVEGLYHSLTQRGFRKWFGRLPLEIRDIRWWPSGFGDSELPAPGESVIQRSSSCMHQFFHSICFGWSASEWSQISQRVLSLHLGVWTSGLFALFRRRTWQLYFRQNTHDVHLPRT